MARCRIRRSPRNRAFRALLPFARALFAVQDVFYCLLGLDRSWLVTTPPSVPIGQAAPYAPKHGYFRDRHGDSLFYREWPPERPEPARAVVIAFDGLGSYSKQFHPLGPALAPRGIALIGLDLPGHGLSQGPRSDLAHLPEILDGIADAVNYFSQVYPNAPVYLLGESLGGTMALRVAARSGRLPALAGLVLSSCEVEPTHLSARGALASLIEIARQVPFLLFWSHARSVDIAGREKLVARGLEIYEHSRVDPLRNNRASIRTIVYAFELILSTLSGLNERAYLLSSCRPSAIRLAIRRRRLLFSAVWQPVIRSSSTSPEPRTACSTTRTLPTCCASLPTGSSDVTHAGSCLDNRVSLSTARRQPDRSR